MVGPRIDVFVNNRVVGDEDRPRLNEILASAKPNTGIRMDAELADKTLVQTFRASMPWGDRNVTDLNDGWSSHRLLESRNYWRTAVASLPAPRSRKEATAWSGSERRRALPGHAADMVRRAPAYTCVCVGCVCVRVCVCLVCVCFGCWCAGQHTHTNDRALNINVVASTAQMTDTTDATSWESNCAQVINVCRLQTGPGPRNEKPARPLELRTHEGKTRTTRFGHKPEGRLSTFWRPPGKPAEFLDFSFGPRDVTRACRGVGWFNFGIV